MYIFPDMDLKKILNTLFCQSKNREVIKLEVRNGGKIIECWEKKESMYNVNHK